MRDHIDSFSPGQGECAARIDRVTRPIVAVLAAAAVLSAGAWAPPSTADVRGEPIEGNAPPIEVEVSGRLEAPFALVRQVLLDLEAFGAWFPATDEWRVLARPSPETARVYGRQSLPWPVADRDYVVEYRWWDEPDGSFVLRADALADAVPASPSGVVRIERMRTRWRIRPEGDATVVVYRFDGDAGGRLPEWAARAGWRSSTGILIERLRDEVTRIRGQAGSPP